MTSDNARSAERDLYQLLGNAEQCKFNEKELRDFFDNRVWLALRQRIAHELDQSYRAIDNLDSTDRVLQRSLGIISALRWFLQEPAAMLEEIQQDDEIEGDKDEEQQTDDAVRQENLEAKLRETFGY